MNPAYMVRQLHEQQGRTFGVKAHLTSLKLLNPRLKAAAADGKN
ncbi:MAG TPA: hypothetical protein VF801_08875 [Rhodocyclaceae bacterium]